MVPRSRGLLPLHAGPNFILICLPHLVVGECSGAQADHLELPQHQPDVAIGGLQREGGHWTGSGDYGAACCSQQGTCCTGRLGVLGRAHHNFQRCGCPLETKQCSR